jgi:hypothetical protein
MVTRTHSSVYTALYRWDFSFVPKVTRFKFPGATVPSTRQHTAASLHKGPASEKLFKLSCLFGQPGRLHLLLWLNIDLYFTQGRCIDCIQTDKQKHSTEANYVIANCMLFHKNINTYYSLFICNTKYTSLFIAAVHLQV